MEDLLDAVRRALERNDRECRQRSRLAELRNRFNRLTRRDREVLAHVLKGALNKQIAAELGIDERSVKRHRRSLMLRLEVTSVAELAQLAAEVGQAQAGLES
jgi:FixJ family two-component response regulator